VRNAISADGMPWAMMAALRRSSPSGEPGIAGAGEQQH